MNKVFLLRFGLAFTLIYAGLDSFLNPNDWLGYVPLWTQNFGISRLLALHLHSLVELLLGLALLFNFKTRGAALMASLDLAIIIAVNGFGRNVLLVTFRDVGLFFMALHLFLKRSY